MTGPSLIVSTPSTFLDDILIDSTGIRRYSSSFAFSLYLHSTIKLKENDEIYHPSKCLISVRYPFHPSNAQYAIVFLPKTSSRLVATIFA